MKSFETAVGDTRHKSCVLTVIDVMLSALSRGGPGKGTTLELGSSETATHLLGECAGALGLRVVGGGGLGKTTRWVGTESLYDAMFLGRAFLEVLLDYDSTILSWPLEDQLVVIACAKDWPQDKFVSYAKYCTAFPMAKFLRNSLPEVPNGFPGNPLFKGKLKRFLKSRIVTRQRNPEIFSPSSSKNARLFWGILQGVKRGAAPVPETFVRAAMLKHSVTLSAPPRGVEPDQEYKSKYASVFQNFKYPVERLHEATTSASFQTKRSEGGARGLIQGDLEEGLILMYESRPGKVVPVYGPIAPTFSETVERARLSPRDVMVSAVLEPLKTRLITKGDTYRMWLSRFYQKALWRHLQNFPQFVATSRPLQPLDLIRGVLDREKALSLEWRGVPKWVSGDYSEATDGSDIRHTKAAFEASLFAGQLNSTSPPSPYVLDVLRSVLYEQTIHYPKKMNIDQIEQVTGQLMGSTLSFPILCTLNVVSYWIALEQYFDRSIDLVELPVLINGDDILFRADDEFYALWQSEIVKVGFRLSLGKNYIHPTLLTINSRLYQYTKDGLLTELGFMNTGLLTSQSKITGREQARVAPIWDYFNEVVAGALDPIRAMRRFFHYNRVKLEELTLKGNYNLFLPWGRGGLGFKSPEGFFSRVTSFQRRLATFLERKFLEDPSTLSHISLVSDRQRVTHTRTRGTPLLEVSALFGPHARGLFEVKDEDSVLLPPLAEKLDPERPELKVRFYTKPLLREFRAGTSRRMAGDVRIFPYKVMERSAYAPLGRDIQGILSPPEFDRFIRQQERRGLPAW